MTIFNWLATTWGLENQETETTATEYSSESSYLQSYSQEQEPEQRAPGMFDWVFGTPEQKPAQTNYQEPDQNQYQRLAASEALNIEGDLHFVQKVQRALDLLASHSPEDLQAIQQSATLIKSADRSGAISWASRIDIAADTLNTSDEYLAGVLRHEAEHNRKRIGNQGLSNSVEEELDCIRRQIECLRRLNADPHEIRHLENQDGTHYQGNVTW